MSGEERVFIAWEEKNVCHEKGNRIVQYYLIDSVGCPLLAIEGRERSLRHMIYSISEECLDYYECRDTPFAGKRWHTRRGVVDWLTSMVSSLNEPSPIPNSKIPETMDGITNPGIQHLVKEELVSRKLKSKGSDIEWLGEASVCSKRLNHYPAILSNGNIIPEHSFVFIMAQEESRYLGYLEDLYEDNKMQKWVKIRWFHHLHEVKCVIPHVDTHPREVFITPHLQVIHAECVDDLASVLTPNDYQKYASFLPESLLSGVLICSRQFKNNMALPFCLSKLHGYYTQPIFSMLRCKQSVPQETVKDHKKHVEEHSASKDLSVQATMSECEPAHQKLKIKISIKGQAGTKLVGNDPKSCASSPFKVGVNIEFLCQDSGMRGCWFKCRVIQEKQQRLKVQYLDIDDACGTGKLEEWIHASRVAAPDKLSMRCPGRLTIRPWPLRGSLKRSFKVGEAVDAWWCDGWWEGVIAGFDVSSRHHFQVYFPGDNRLMTFPRKNLRISRDWIDNKWVDIKPKHDICSFISAATASSSMPSLCSPLAKVSGASLPPAETNN
ncbi:unnamed protein product [Cuscuta epithymum]|uniref:BAH domain-containing protein n=1 Tax=Cuscuta epithymum TaxID=186058 RepID=A0AAV0C2L7_9ASTE|nr:unnamed protein product [Cuscuta epithymum]